MSVTVKFTKKERLFARLREVVPNVDKELTEANEKTAIGMVAMAKRLAPRDDGDLQNSIIYFPGRRPTSFVITAGGALTTRPVREGADASYDYALGQEYGTSKMPANPFFWPSFRALRKGMKSRAGRALRKAIKQAVF
jgi:HK97 gp10 family phage protein